MSDNSASPPPSMADVREHLHTIAQLLRHVHHLDPAAQALLADLLEELSKTLAVTDASWAEVAHLTESTSHLVQAVRERKEPGVLEAARDRLDRAVIAVESKAPVLAGITRRLAEMLANLGI
jgi:hypothetical protein